MNLRPNEPICWACLGMGYAVAWCDKCAGSFRPADHYQHARINASLHCRACGGSGRLEDMVRRRITGDYSGGIDMLEVKRWTMRYEIGAAIAKKIDGEIYACLSSKAAPSMWSRLTSKLRGVLSTR